MIKHEAIHFTLLRSPTPLSKKIFLNEVGEIQKESLGNLVDGTFETKEVKSLSEFSELLTTLDPHQALIYGTFRDADKGLITSSARKKKYPGKYEKYQLRDSAHTQWPKGPGVIFIDYDPPNDVTPLHKEELVRQIRAACPELADVEMLWRPSASSNIIYSNTGEIVQGVTGQHLYIAVSDAAQIPKIGKLIADRLWLAGYGRYDIAKNGALLERTIVDTAVWQPERMDFCGGAWVIEPLKQNPLIGEIIPGEKKYLNCDDATPLTVKETMEIARLKAESKKEKAPLAEKVKTAHVDQRVNELVGAEATPVAKDAARNKILAAIDGNTLCNGFVLTHSSGQKITAQELLADPEKWHEERFHDPSDPNYGNDPRIAYANTLADSPYIYSHAHGGKCYYFESINTTKTGIAGVDSDIIDQVYSQFLSILDLSESHRKLLERRGMSPAEIQAGGYRSLRQIDKKVIIRKIRAEITDEALLSIPGFYRSKYGIWFDSSEGLVIPIRDSAGKIKALKFPQTDQTRGKKYNGCEDKNAPDRSIHVARPVTGQVDQKKSIYITDTPLKANIAAERLKAIVISVPEVPRGKKTEVLTEVLKVLNSLEAQQVIIAYDADTVIKPAVEKTARDLISACLHNLPGVEIYRARWDLGQAKGIDDLLVSGGTYITEKQEIAEVFGQKVKVKPELYAITITPRISLEDARQKHRAFFDTILTDPDRDRTGGGQYVLTSGTGTGKTSAAIDAVINAIKKKTITGRVLIVSDNKSKIKEEIESRWERIEKHLGREIFILEGRSDQEIRNEQLNPFYCPYAKSYVETSQKRHLSFFCHCLQNDFLGEGQKVRIDCEYVRLLRAKTGRENALCPYLESVKKVKAKSTKLVITTKASIFNGAKLIGGFDIIIVDETMIDSLYEKAQLSAKDALQYIAKMDSLKAMFKGRNSPQAEYWGETNPARIFISQILILAITGGEANFIKSIKDAATRAGVDLEEIIAQIRTLDHDDKRKRYLFEAAYEEDNKRQYPLRFFEDLLKAIEQEIDWPIGADTRLKVQRRDDITFLSLIIPRQHIIDYIRNGKSKEVATPNGEDEESITVRPTLINLDATPSPLLKAVFPDIQEIKYQVPEHLEITQIIDAVYTKTTLKGKDGEGKALDRVSKVIQKRQEEAAAQDPVVLCAKTFNPDAKTGSKKLDIPGARFGHYDYHTKASNAFQETDHLSIMGFYMPPMDDLQAMVEAVRHSQEPRSKKEGKEVRTYLRPDGSIHETGVVWHHNEDPLLNDVLKHSQESPIIQALGRGRAALRTPETPLNVDIYTAVPIKGLPIKELLTTEYILNDNRRNAEQTRKYNQTLFEAGKAKALGKIEEVMLSDARPRSYNELCEKVKIHKWQLSRYGFTGEWYKATFENRGDEKNIGQNAGEIDVARGYPLVTPYRYNIYIKQQGVTTPQLTEQPNQAGFLRINVFPPVPSAVTSLGEGAMIPENFPPSKIADPYLRPISPAVISPVKPSDERIRPVSALDQPPGDVTPVSQSPVPSPASPNPTADLAASTGRFIDTCPKCGRGIFKDAFAFTAPESLEDQPVIWCSDCFGSLKKTGRDDYARTFRIITKNSIMRALRENRDRCSPSCKNFLRGGRNIKPQM
jgi:hypothetical protein